jgi:hypothetical protein
MRPGNLGGPSEATSVADAVFTGVGMPFARRKKEAEDQIETRGRATYTFPKEEAEAEAHYGYQQINTRSPGHARERSWRSRTRCQDEAVRALLERRRVSHCSAPQLFSLVFVFCSDDFFTPADLSLIAFEAVASDVSAAYSSIRLLTSVVTDPTIIRPFPFRTHSRTPTVSAFSASVRMSRTENLRLCSAATTVGRSSARNHAAWGEIGTRELAEHEQGRVGGSFRWS